MHLLSHISSSRRTSGILCFVISFLILFATSSAAVNVYDEGVILTGALRVLAGETPSRDFYTNYGPAQFYLVAAAFKLFGTNVLVARIYDAAVASGIAVMTWISTGYFRSKPLAVACTAFVLAIVVSSRFNLFPITPSIVIILGACLILTKCMVDRSSPVHYLPLSLLILCLFLFRYDLGVMAMVAFGLPFAAVQILDLWRGEARWLDVRNAILVNVTALLIGLSLIGVVLDGAGILRPAINDILTYNTVNYLTMRKLPFPGFSQIWIQPLDVAVYIMPACLVLVLMTGFAVLRQTLSRGASTRDLRLISLVVFTSASVIFYGKGIVRASPSHMLISNVPAIITAFFSLDFLLPRYDVKLKLGTKPILAAIMFVSCFFLFYSLKVKLPKGILLAGHHTNIPTLSPFWIDADRMEAVRFVNETTAPNARILSATGRHDKIFVNDIAIYFLAQRLPGTRWHQYDPGVQTSEVVQKDMITEIERYRVDEIVRDVSFDNISEPNGSAESSGIRILDAYINQNYSPSRKFGAISVCRRVTPWQTNAATP